ncbi:YebC/PmpR family DNA-binding transcriptional regulator [Spirochaetia bacterium 38H-sp]|uniref:Probable transcriptional regulatory protein WKV44_04455 n=1 Tax=Rarispira pelagica TaxID=3141764 RepID=A0ABU9UAV3_9SPIR
MSGHSKWATIKHKKSAMDAKRGKIFTKLIKEISIAARMGGGDPESNPRLRTAILKARAANMPKDNIERAIKKGTGEAGGADYVEIVYEAYGPGGVAIIIEALTDNKNRTASEVRHILSKHGCSLGETGCVSYMFKKKGLLTFDASKFSEDDILEVALDAGAEDVSVEDGIIEVYTDPSSFEAVQTALSDKGYVPETAEISLIPDMEVSLDKDTAAKVLKLVEALEDNDDVQSVSTNLDLPDELVE